MKEDEIIELEVPEKEQKGYIDSDELWFEEELQELEETGGYGDKEVKLDRAVIKAIARRPTMMKILMFMYENKNADFYRKELTNQLGLPHSTILFNLRKLCNAGILYTTVPASVDKRTICYRISNYQTVERIINVYQRFVSKKLLRFIPADGILIENLEKHAEFMKQCDKLRLTVDEGVECIKKNKNVQMVSGYYGTQILKLKK